MIKQLEIFRFVSFLLVFLWHARGLSGMGASCSQGAALAVSFFFCLSGFLSAVVGFGSCWEIHCLCWCACGSNVMCLGDC